jgi:hypothetical protein
MSMKRALGLKGDAGFCVGWDAIRDGSIISWNVVVEVGEEGPALDTTAVSFPWSELDTVSGSGLEC